MTELKDWLNSINFNKNNLIEEDTSVLKFVRVCYSYSLPPHVLAQ